MRVAEGVGQRPRRPPREGPGDDGVAGPASSAARWVADVPASGQHRNAVPSAAATAPSARTRATPVPSVIPPARPAAGPSPRAPPGAGARAVRRRPRGRRPCRGGRPGAHRPRRPAPTARRTPAPRPPGPRPPTSPWPSTPRPCPATPRTARARAARTSPRPRRAVPRERRDLRVDGVVVGAGLAQRHAPALGLAAQVLGVGGDRRGAPVRSGSGSAGRKRLAARGGRGRRRAAPRTRPR